MPMYLEPRFSGLEFPLRWYNAYIGMVEEIVP